MYLVSVHLRPKVRDVVRRLLKPLVGTGGEGSCQAGEGGLRW